MNFHFCFSSENFGNSFIMVLYSVIPIEKNVLILIELLFYICISHTTHASFNHSTEFQRKSIAISPEHSRFVLKFVASPKTRGQADTIILLYSYFLKTKIEMDVDTDNGSIQRPGAGFAGNTSYINSTLQALFHAPLFVKWITSNQMHVHRSKCEESCE